MSAASEKKAVQYLTQGRVTVIEHDDVSALIVVQGSGVEPYRVIYGQGQWVCSCPARKPLCAHVIAARLISPLRSETTGLTPQREAELDALLGDVHDLIIHRHTVDNYLGME